MNIKVNNNVLVLLTVYINNAFFLLLYLNAVVDSLIQVPKQYELWLVGGSRE